ncbi:MAG TPA: quinone-dependent dihydroorotate dehydrogenase [Steroidobacteraceae bacterium]|nr:quinone-dependent dihydroorotate dehydrogenase [Steroidobacteraceae bacterium]
MRAGATPWLARAALPLLLRLPPELSHVLGLRAIKLLGSRWQAAAAPAALATEACGLRFAHPVGLAAGFDKNGDYLDSLGALGFSHVEIGTVTPRPQAGNRRPRLFRLRGAQALINRMGFNNRGADYVAARVAAAKYRGVRGISIGKNATTPLPRAVDDYLACLRTLYAVADYFAINVSSPNTQGLRTLQGSDALAGIIEPLQEERERLAARHGRRVPLLIKISPDLDDAELRSMAASLRSHALDGVIATNTSTSIAGFEAELARARKDGISGGLSGRPLRDKALASLRALRRALGNDFPIIGVGGLMSADDVCARLEAGATLVQLYTGFVYRGPALLAESLQALTR